MRQQEMDKKNIVIIKLHSVVDLITNSSTELFIVDTSKAEGILKEMFEFIKKEAGNCNETTISSWEDSSCKDDYIMPEDIDFSQVYVCRIDQNDNILMGIMEKFFTVLNLKYKDE